MISLENFFRDERVYISKDTLLLPVTLRVILDMIKRLSHFAKQRIKRMS